jgi:hypothetical protein
MKHSTHLLPSGPLATAQAAYAALPAETRYKLVEWIKTTIAPAKKVYDLNSYSIKHDAEDAIGIYISNDQFKGAMLACGHPPIPRSVHEINWQFRIKSIIPRSELPPPGQRGLGGFLRAKRTAQGVGLRELARNVGISPAYLSKIETGQFPPPAEDKLVAIAEQLNLNSDVLMAQAGRVPADVLATMKQQPIQMNNLVRAAGQLMTDAH